MHELNKIKSCTIPPECEKTLVLFAHGQGQVLNTDGLDKGWGELGDQVLFFYFVVVCLL